MDGLATPHSSWIALDGRRIRPQTHNDPYAMNQYREPISVLQRFPRRSEQEAISAQIGHSIFLLLSEPSSRALQIYLSLQASQASRNWSEVLAEASEKRWPHQSYPCSGQFV